MAGKVIICDKNVGGSGGGGHGLKTVIILHTLQNCHNIGLSSTHCKTVVISVSRAHIAKLSNVAGKVIICDKNVGASSGGRGLKAVVIS